MGDFYLDLRLGDRAAAAAERVQPLLTWCEDTTTSRFSLDWFELVVARSDDADLWAPATIVSSARIDLIVGLAGRIALSEEQWMLGQSSDAVGGLACRAVAELYQRDGLAALEALSGNFAIVIFDRRTRSCHLVTDRAGMQIVYGTDGSPVYCTHPDVLATATDGAEDLDEISLAEFVTAGRLTFPHTYYKKISALSPACVFSATYTENWPQFTGRRYGRLISNFDGNSALGDLADAFAATFRDAIHRRSLPILGKTAVAMSGGMDSRAVLCCTNDPAKVLGFSLVDTPNAESAAAASVARACSTPFHLQRRAFDHYGAAAEMGARIGGGMGSLASNHFLSSRDWLRQQGVENLLTGCYADYLFKALALNISETALFRRERLAPVSLEFYRPIYRDVAQGGKAAIERISSSLPPRNQSLESRLFELERSRTFPLAYEGDSAQRVIAQRVFPWCVPMADKDLLDVYCRIPWQFKLNARLFREMLRRVCPASVLAIPNSNTGAPILAGQLTRTFYRYRSALHDRMQAKAGKSIATRGSWPNWEYYLHHSSLVRQQWERRSEASVAVLSGIVPRTLLQREVTTFRGREVELFQRLWTLKLWLECRVGSPSYHAQKLVASAS